MRHRNPIMQIKIDVNSLGAEYACIKILRNGFGVVTLAFSKIN